MADTLTPFRPKQEQSRTPPVTEIRALRRERTRVRQRLLLPFILSSVLAVVAMVASAIGFFNPDIYRDPAMTAGNARGTALVILVVAVPLLVGSLIMSARGSARFGVIWIGTLAYLLYNAVLFSFSMTFNRLFLLYVAMFGLALWALVTVLMQVDPITLRDRFKDSTPVSGIGLYLLLSALLFFVAWMRDIVPALIDNTLPASLDNTVMLTNAVEVIDLSISLPLLALAGIWIWQRKPWGFFLAGVLLVMFTIETFGVSVDQIFGHRSDPSQSLDAVPVMVVLTFVGLFVTTIYMRNLREDVG